MTSPIIHLVCPPTPTPSKKKVYIAFAFHSSWVLQSPPEKLMAILMQNFVGARGREGGGRRTRIINMGDVQIECIEDKFLVTPRISSDRGQKSTPPKIPRASNESPKNPMPN